MSARGWYTLALDRLRMTRSRQSLNQVLEANPDPHISVSVKELQRREEVVRRPQADMLIEGLMCSADQS